MTKYIVLLCISCFTATIYGQNTALQYKKLADEGLELLKQQNIPAAIEKYKQALKIDSSKVEANYGLGTAYLYYCEAKKTDCNNALFYLNKAANINDNYRNCYYNRGRARAYIGDYKGALEDFNAAVKKDSTDKESFFSRAMVKIKLKDDNGACEDFYTSGQLGFEPARKMFEKNCGIKK